MKDLNLMVKQYVKQDECPLNILMFIVDKCNYSCPYCYNRTPRHLMDADAKLFLNFIKNVRKNVVQRKINVSLIGGEPTLHPQIHEFVDELLKIDNVTVELLTNFSNSVDFFIPFLQRGVNLAASWHKSPNDLQNFSYVEKMKQIPWNFFKNNQIEVRIMMENDNWDNSKKVFYSLYPMFKKYIEISLLSQNNGLPYKYTDKQLEEFRQMLMLIKYKREFFTVEYSDGTEENLSFNDMYLNPRVNFHLWKCNAGLDYFYVHVNGDVYNCQSYYEHCRKPLYNIVKTNGEYIPELHRPCICSVDYCSCDFDVFKEKILKNAK